MLAILASCIVAMRSLTDCANFIFVLAVQEGRNEKVTYGVQTHGLTSYKNVFTQLVLTCSGSLVPLFHQRNHCREFQNWTHSVLLDLCTKNWQREDMSHYLHTI